MAQKYTVSTSFKAEDKLTNPINKISSKIKTMTFAMSKFGLTSKKSFIQSSQSAGVFNSVLSKTSGLIGGFALAGLAKDAAMAEESLLGAAAGFGVYDRGTETFKKIKQAVQGVNSNLNNFSPEQKAKGLHKFALAGFSVNDSLNFMNNTLKFSKATQTDLSTAADIATDVYSALGTSINIGSNATEKFNAVMNSMLKTTMVANTDLPTLFEALKTSAPHFVSAGQKMTDLQSALAVLADSGLKGSLAGRQLGIGIKRLKAPTSEVSKGIKSLGLSVRDANGDMRPFFSILEDLRKVQAKTGKATFDLALKNIVGSDALGTYLTLLRTSDKTIENKFRKPLENSNGTLEKTFSLMSSGVLSSFTRMINSFKKLASVVVNSDNINISFFDNIANSVSTFADFIDTNRDFVKSIFEGTKVVAKIVGVLLGAKLAMGAFRLVISTTLFAVNPLIASFKVLRFATLGIGKAFGIARLGMLSFALPITLIAGALYGVYKLFTMNDEGMNKWLFAIKTGIKTVLFPLLKIIEGISWGLNKLGVISDDSLASLQKLTEGPDFKMLAEKFKGDDATIKKEIDNQVKVSKKDSLDINVTTEKGVTADVVASSGLNLVGVPQ